MEAADTWALVTLVIGICTVLGMIIALKVNAFISLITAAMLVSVMAPGAISDKINRVAQAFGSSAAGIGIVIALAAVIGQCMMESGAADRIVRAFMKLLGQKRAPLALMGSGFVLSVPVFFDTVFYLLVPLARSLYRSTRSNYLLYILAICAGGAITHTLVPPTPGPLVMADQLGIDVGLMILVGGIVGLPAAVAGLATAYFMDRHIRISAKITVAEQNEHEPEPVLPGLMMSLLPVLLPVIMISANTAATTIADAEHAPRFSVTDVTDWDRLSQRLSTPDDPAGAWLLKRLELTAGADLSGDEARQQIVDRLNAQLVTRDLYQPRHFDSALAPAWLVHEQLAEKSADSGADQEKRRALSDLKTFYGMAAKDRSQMKRVDLERMHRLLLEAAFPDCFARHEWNTSKRAAADLFGLLGNANLALLLSTAISIFVYWKTRQPGLSKLAQGIEESLMSGGAIILITAAGGAFGAMLREAQVGTAILRIFSMEGGGIAFLLIGFGIAALMKVAQGSSTTAMIVTSGMMASVLSGTKLDFNVVYIATAIGGGSLIGSWMNDSGFWIVARMSGMSEPDALKTWTPLLIVLGTVTLLTTILLTYILPLRI
ncbi:MAG: GntP family permease [Planctomycetaceae bacterium]|nr:GntP family permease [Planctomycetaceae bacterium]